MSGRPFDAIQPKIPHYFATAIDCFRELLQYVLRLSYIGKHISHTKTYVGGLDEYITSMPVKIGQKL